MHVYTLLDLGYPWDIPNLTRDILINQLILCHNCDGRVQEHSSAHCSGWTLTFLLPPSKTSSPMIRWSHCSTWTCRMSWDLQKGRTPTSGVYQSWTIFYAGIWCGTEMAELCTERSHTSQLLVLFTPNMPRHWFSQHKHSGILCVGYPILIPYLSLIVPGSYHVYSILIPCLSYACRTLCSVCPSILLYWKTPQTSLLKTAQTQPRSRAGGEATSTR